MSFVARWGAACGTPFDAKKFLEQHPQYDWMNGLLKIVQHNPGLFLKQVRRNN
jgi:hypothetical protein